MRDTMTVIHVTDPRHASVRVDAASASDELPAGDSPNEVLLRRGVVPTGDQTSAAYELYAARNPDHSIGLRWETHLPLSFGERLSLLSARGNLRFPDASARDVLPPETSHSADFRLPLCAKLSGSTTENGTVEYDSAVRPWALCGGGPSDVVAPFVMRASPRDVEIHQITTPNRWAAIGAIALDALLVLPIALPFRLVGNSLQNDANQDTDSPSSASLRSEGQTFTTISNVFLIAGGVVALLCVPTLVAPSRDEIVYPPPN
jgi:hypothetical protein